MKGAYQSVQKHSKGVHHRGVTKCRLPLKLRMIGKNPESQNSGKFDNKSDFEFVFDPWGLGIG